MEIFLEHDFEYLRMVLMDRLPYHQQRVLAESLSSCTKEWIERKEAILKREIPVLAIEAVKVSDVIDSLVQKFAEQVRRSFGISVKALANREDSMVLEQHISTCVACALVQAGNADPVRLAKESLARCGVPASLYPVACSALSFVLQELKSFALHLLNPGMSCYI